MKYFLDDEVEYTSEFIEEDTPVRGNILASGDDALDKSVEDETIARLHRGDEVAWCAVKVTAKWARPGGMSHYGVATIGGCNYATGTTLDEIVEDQGLKLQALDALLTGIKEQMAEFEAIRREYGDFSHTEEPCQTSSPSA